MKTVCAIVWCLVSCLSYGVSSLTTQGHVYTLFRGSHTWNEAQDICAASNQQMLAIKTPAEMRGFKSAFTNIYLKKDIWIGLYDRAQDTSTVTEYQWQGDCSLLGSYTAWDVSISEPNDQRTDHCVRMTRQQNLFRTHGCGEDYLTVCEDVFDECPFETLEGRLITETHVNVSSQDVASCQQLCRTTDAGDTECAACDYTPSLSLCRMAMRSTLYIGEEQPATSASASSTVHIKRCFIAHNNSTRISVTANRNSKANDRCKLTTTASSSTPGTTTVTTATTITTTPSTSVTNITTSTTATPTSSAAATLTIGTTKTLGTTTTSTALTNSTTSRTVTATSSAAETLTIGTTTTISTTTPSTALTNSTTSRTATATSSAAATVTIDNTTSTTDSILTTTIPQQKDDVTTAVLPTTTVTHSFSSTTTATTTTTHGKSSTLPTSVTATLTRRFTGTLKSGTTRSAPTAATDHNKPLLQGQKPCNTTRRICVCGAKKIDGGKRSSGLLLEKKILSSYRRSKTSAIDERPSAVSIGASGVGVLIIVAVLIILIDVDKYSGSLLNICRRKGSTSVIHNK